MLVFTHVQKEEESKIVLLVYGMLLRTRAFQNPANSSNFKTGKP
jgi:hypothetical protein